MGQCLPNTITIDTPTRKDTVIRKNDIVVAAETKPQLNEYIACKTLGKYNRNWAKILAKTRKLYLDEQDEIEKLAPQHIAPTQQGPSQTGTEQKQTSTSNPTVKQRQKPV